VLPHVRDKGWSPQLIEDVLKDIILRDSQNRRRQANKITKASGGVVKRGRKHRLREGVTEFSTPDPSTVIPMADPNYIQARTLITRSAVPSQVQGQMVVSGDATEQPGSQIVVASQSRKRAGAAPIEGSDIATMSAPKKAKTQKRLQQQQSTAGIVKHKKAKHTKAKPKSPLESPFIFINNAYIVLQQSLSFRKWSRILDENSAVEDIRRKPIYFYRRLDGSVGTVSDAEEYQAFLGEFRNCLLLKDAQGAIKIDRVRHVVRVSYSILPASFHVTDDRYMSPTMVTPFCPQAFIPSVTALFSYIYPRFLLSSTMVTSFCPQDFALFSVSLLTRHRMSFMNIEKSQNLRLPMMATQQLQAQTKYSILASPWFMVLDIAKRRQVSRPLGTLFSLQRKKLSRMLRQCAKRRRIKRICCARSYWRKKSRLEKETHALLVGGSQPFLRGMYSRECATSLP
jgi:hypothetical protein